MNPLFKSFWLICILLCAGCLHENDRDALVFVFDLDRNALGWRAGFADYPEGQEELYELESAWGALPPPLASLNGIFISGNNHSDDLFMYIKRRLVRLKPDTRYALTFEVEFATNADSGCFGIGGSPGESVTVKAGATRHESLADRRSQGNLRMNIDHGDQSSGGSDAIAIGDVAGSGTDCMDEIYELKTLSSDGVPFEAYTGGDGALWALFATDSGFEGATGIYFTRIRIIAREI
jgi:hypothetical protein